jgi:single-strand DNA-binding protein
MINTITVSGNLGRDVELKYVGENAVATFSLANARGYGDKKHTNWINCVAWRGLGEICAKYLSKGSRVTVTGELRIRSYEPHSGKRYVTEIICQDVDFPPKQGDMYHEALNMGTEISDEDIVPF